MDRTDDRTPERVPDRAALLLGAAARPSPSEDRPPCDRRDPPPPPPGRPAPRVTTDSVEAYYRAAPLRHAPSFY